MMKQLNLSVFLSRPTIVAEPLRLIKVMEQTHRIAVPMKNTRRPRSGTRFLSRSPCPRDQAGGFVYLDPVSWRHITPPKKKAA